MTSNSQATPVEFQQMTRKKWAEIQSQMMFNIIVWVLAHGLAPSMVEHPLFRNIFVSLQLISGVQFPTRRSIRYTSLPAMLLALDVRSLEIFKVAASLTLIMDAWSSGSSFMGFIMFTQRYASFPFLFL